MQFKFYKNSCIFWYLEVEGSRLEKIKLEKTPSEVQMSYAHLSYVLL